MWLILPLRRRRSSNCVSLLSQRHIGLSCLVRLIGIDRSLHQISAFYHAICLVEQRLCIVKTWVGLYWTWGGRGRRGGGAAWWVGMSELIVFGEGCEKIMSQRFFPAEVQAAKAKQNMRFCFLSFWSLNVSSSLLQMAERLLLLIRFDLIHFFGYYRLIVAFLKTFLRE